MTLFALHVSPVALMIFNIPGQKRLISILLSCLCSLHFPSKIYLCFIYDIPFHNIELPFLLLPHLLFCFASVVLLLFVLGEAYGGLFLLMRFYLALF